MSNKIYCAFDMLNCPIDKSTGKEIHICSKYGTAACNNCGSRYNGDKVKEYMATHDRIEVE